MNPKLITLVAALLVGAAYFVLSERTSSPTPLEEESTVDSSAHIEEGTSAPRSSPDKTEGPGGNGRQDVSFAGEPTAAVGWWADPNRLGAYYSKFEEVLEPSRRNWGAGFEEGLTRLQELDRTLQKSLGRFPNRIDWVELGELGGPEAIYVTGILGRWGREDAPTRRALQKLHFESDPFGVKPHCLLSYLSEKEISLTPQQSEEVQQIFFGWIGERARLQQSAQAFTADVVARQRSDGKLMEPMPNGSELRPAELSLFEDSQNQIFDGYRSALANFLTKEGIEVTLWKE